ncbi:MAG: hypothetical protein CMJ75_13315 [Planctomycetaceae bacterium]|nr:hypothetical protein [Planctomycetaceae bacterium]
MNHKWTLFEDWVVLPKQDTIIESEFECEFLQKCIQIRDKKAKVDQQFHKDIEKIKSGVYKISFNARKRLLELGYKI